MGYIENLFYGASPEIFKRANDLRKRMTPAESALWTLLRNKQLEGYKFRRQHPAKNFILDFYCHQLKLSIELDGVIHTDPDQADYDKRRTFELNEMGIEVLRFQNEDLWEDVDGVLGKILGKIEQIRLSAPPRPSPFGEGESST
jgi:very-short-patch-repair endonuclease